MKRYLPNLLTLLRAAGAVGLLFLPPVGVAFWTVYLLCGVTDMVDGPLARRWQVQSRTGAILDSAADLLFMAACAWRLIPLWRLPQWIWLWAAALALGQGILMLMAWKAGKMELLHQDANRICGMGIYMAAPFLQGERSVLLAVLLCTLATAAERGMLISPRSGTE